MRAWTIIAKGEPLEVLKLAERTLPPPDAGQLAIRVIASGLALPDVAMCRGTYQLTPPTPFTPGLDFVGSVIAAGPDTTMPIGVRVMGISAFHLGHGSLEQECLAREGAVYPVPEDMDDPTAAAFTIAYLTAYVGLIWRGRMSAGETVLVHGATGGTGAAAVQLAKAKGARVIATAGTPQKVALSLAAGADEAIDYNAADFVEEVMAATDGRGVDIVYDPVGGDIFERSIECTARDGRLLPIGSACGRWGAVSSSEFTRRGISVVGVMPTGYPRTSMLAMHDELSGLYRDGKITAPIDRIVGFEETPRHLQDMADRKVNGRVVVICE
jgi:NADPH2:quinone reductase